MTTQLDLIQRKWVDDAFALALRQARKLGSFTMEQLRDEIVEQIGQPDHVNWHGILATKLKREGKINRIGYRPSTRKERNGAVVAVWEAVA